MSTPAIVGIVAAVIVWVGLVFGMGVAWGISRTEMNGLKAGQTLIQEWIKAHEREAKDRDRAIQQLEIANERLTTMASMMTTHLERMEKIASVVLGKA